MSDKAAGQKTRSPEGCDENGPAAALLLSHVRTISRERGVSTAVCGASRIYPTTSDRLKQLYCVKIVDLSPQPVDIDFDNIRTGRTFIDSLLSMASAVSANFSCRFAIFVNIYFDFPSSSPQPPFQAKPIGQGMRIEIAR
jgi:hypothetical protein